MLILSLVLTRKQSTKLFGGLLFAALLCWKHIFLYLAPAYFVYFLRAYCLDQKYFFRIQFLNSSKLALGLFAVFAIAFGPFGNYDDIKQIVTRLFPFARGLCHAYWAPNIWALYSFADRVLLYGKVTQFLRHSMTDRFSGSKIAFTRGSDCIE